MTILDKIVEQTKEDLRRQMRKVSAHDLESFAGYEKSRRDFKGALSGDGLAIIAEIKKASPSKGVIREDFDPLRIAESYLKGGAAALSVLTDKPFFRGDLRFLEDISSRFDIPLLRKDFIVDPYQIKEARAYGADAVLLIVSVTAGRQLDELLHAADEFGLHALVECYSQEEVEELDWNEITLFGVNNRDLRSFEVDLHRGVELLRKSPVETVRVSESGLSTPEDLKYLVDHEIDAALIGEFFMRQADPGRAVADLLGQMDDLIDKDSEEEVHN